MKISEIKVGKRFRKAMGDIDGLAASIKDIDLLQPVVVNKEGMLIAGLRRLKAYKKLGWEDVPIRVVDQKDVTKGQLAENTLRKPLQPDENYHAWMTMEELKRGPAEFPSDSDGNERRKRAAKMLGISTDTLSKTKQVMESDDKELIKLLEDTGNVNRTYRELQKRKRAANKPAPVPGKYRTIVIDPPWPIDKIERETVPTQGPILDYKTMTVDAIKAMKLPVDPNGCHLYLWATQKYLPAAFEIVQGWGFKYVFTMVWHKNGGFQPFGLPQYNCEFILFGRIKGLEFTDIKAFPCCFDAKRGEHSEKPQEFYDLIQRVSPSPHIDIFGRKARTGWEVWGDEVKKNAK